jgi:hypothetical protein
MEPIDEELQLLLNPTQLADSGLALRIVESAPLLVSDAIERGVVITSLCDVRLTVCCVFLVFSFFDWVAVSFPTQDTMRCCKSHYTSGMQTISFMFLVELG